MCEHPHKNEDSLHLDTINTLISQEQNYDNMTSSPSKSGYKWWESDDKTKRLYTELLAEKIAKSPKKTAKTSTLTRSLSSCSDLRSRIQALEYQGSPSGSPIKRSSSIRSLPSSEESDTSQRGSGHKYTFETVTMDTLAKYEYIKSPKKKPFGAKDSSSLLSSSPSPPSSGSDEEYEKKKSFSMRKTYDVKGRMSRETAGFHGNHEKMSELKNKSAWAWSSNDNAVSNQGRWSSSSTDMSIVGDKGKSPATPTKSYLSPSASPRSSSHDSDTWMKPNPMFMLMTSSQKPELKSFGLSDNTKAPGTPSKTVCTKERNSKKLEEVPEYKSSSSEESTTGDSRSDRSSGFIGRLMGRTFKKDSEGKPSHNSKKFNFKQASSSDDKSGSGEDDSKTGTRVLNTSYKKDNDRPNGDSKKVQEKGEVKINAVDQVEGELGINQITKRFQSLCEEVEQLEFKMFEFSDDIRKLKIGIGIKDKDNKTDSEEQTGQCKHQGKHAFTLAAGKDLLSERVTARALLMRQYSSPSKPPKSIAKLLQDTGIDKEMAEVDACKTKALEEKLRKINEKDLTEDEIQEVLKSAKSKYIDRPNYLEDIGLSVRSQRKKG